VWPPAATRDAPLVTAFVDAHVHFWDHGVGGLRWVFLEPDFEHPRLGALKTLDAPRFAVDELRIEAGSCAPTKIVHVQAAQAADPVIETAWLQALSERTGWPNAIVGYCNLADADAGDVVARHRASSRFRGVRDLPAGARLGDPDVIRGFGLVAATGTPIEVMTSWESFDQLRALADEWPATTVVLGHAGLPVERTDEYFAHWSAGLRRRAAAAPNVVCKVSALASGADPSWTTVSIRPWVLGCIDAFGPDRCMFASNWPVDKIFGTYARLVEAYDEITSGFSDVERTALFARTAERVYDI
jgi:predicted TIM-barrel fold metal-dependent hydrolase